MSNQIRVLVFAGSAREGSYNKKLARLAAEAARRAGAEATFLDLRDLPMPVFDQDLEARLPEEHPEARKLKDLMRAHDAFIIASPENNSSYSALLKNAFDWASRRREGEKPHECYGDKPVAIMSASPGALGGIRGLQTLRLLLGNLRMIVLPDTLAVGHADTAFDESGRLKDAKQAASVENVASRLVRFAADCSRVRRVPA
jgi:chromate reductase, NAD(P)H dehydrogenase (quinone)